MEMEWTNKSFVAVLHFKSIGALDSFVIVCNGLGHSETSLLVKGHGRLIISLDMEDDFLVAL